MSAAPPPPALRPARMPLRGGGAWRKRWRYVAAFGPEVMVCAARVEVGPAAQTFWAIWDRAERRLIERTRTRLPGRRGEVWTEAPGGGRPIEHAPDQGSVARIEARDRQAGPVSATLRLGGGRWVEVLCPTGEGGEVWTRKRADVPVRVELRVAGASRQLDARGVEDESAGYQPQPTELPPVVRPTPADQLQTVCRGW